MQQISPAQLKRWLADPAAPRPVLLDVREPSETAACPFPGALSMPMGAVPARYPELERDAPTVVICQMGGRSYQVAMFLESQGFARVYNLGGGMGAWSLESRPAPSGP